jgi:hypothetical protein
MPVVQPPSARYTTEDLGSSIRITVPSRKNWVAVAFLSFSLIVWGSAEIYAGRILVAWLLPGEALIVPGGTSEILVGSVFLFIWFSILTVFGILILRAWLWQLTSKEAIEASDHSITIRRVILGFGCRHEYLAEHIKDLRASPVQSSRTWPAVANSWGLSGGALAFDYGAKAFYFASGADEAEAKQIVAMIKARFPALARAAGENVYSE